MTIKELKAIYEEYKEICRATEKPTISLLFNIVWRRREDLEEIIDAHRHLLYIRANDLKKTVDQAFKTAGLNYCTMSFDYVAISIKEKDDSAKLYGDFTEISLRLYGQVIPLQMCNLNGVKNADFCSGNFTIPLIDFLDNLTTPEPSLANTMELIYRSAWDTLRQRVKANNQAQIAKNNAEKKLYQLMATSIIERNNISNELESYIRKQVRLEKENIKLADEDVFLS